VTRWRWDRLARGEADERRLVRAAAHRFPNGASEIDLPDKIIPFIL
jgi:hypothetical protein